MNDSKEDIPLEVIEKIIQICTPSIEIASQLLCRRPKADELASIFFAALHFFSYIEGSRRIKGDLDKLTFLKIRKEVYDKIKKGFINISDYSCNVITTSVIEDMSYSRVKTLMETLKDMKK